VSAVDIQTGRVNLFNQDNTSVDDFHKAAFASTCIPGLFPPFKWTRDGRDHMFSDNFVIQNSNPYSAIHECMELVGDESKITVDVLLLGEMAEFEVIPDYE